MYVVCYSKSTKEWMEQIFKAYPNVKYIYADDNKLDFKLFNDEYFTIKKPNKTNEQNKPILEAVAGGIK